MPKFTSGNEISIITWDSDDFLGGLAYQRGSPGDNIKAEMGSMTTMLSFNPYRNIGFAQPGFEPVDVTNASTQASGSYFKSYVNLDTDEDLLLTNAGKISKLDWNETTPVLASDATWPHTITPHGHSSLVGEDIITYKHNLSSTLTTSYFYSWRDNDDWDVGTFTPASTFNDDFMSTVPASPLSGDNLTGGAGLPHFMFVGADDVLYMLSGRYVHGYDGLEGANGTFIAQALVLPAGFIGTTACKYSNFAVIGGINSGSVSWTSISSSTVPSFGEGYVYFWDYLNQDVYNEVYVGDKMVISVFVDQDGSLYALTTGQTGGTSSVKLRRWNGQAFELVPNGEITNVMPTQRGIIVNGYQKIFNIGGEIYGVGSPYPKQPFGINQLFSCNQSTASGILINHNPTYGFFASGGAGLQKFSSGYAASNFRTTFFEPDAGEHKMWRIKKIKVWFRNTVTDGRPLNLGFQLRGKESTTTASIFESLTAVSQPLVKEYDYNIGTTPFPAFSTIGLAGQWGAGTTTDAPIISKVAAYIEKVNL